MHARTRSHTRCTTQRSLRYMVRVACFESDVAQSARALRMQLGSSGGSDREYARDMMPEANHTKKTENNVLNPTKTAQEHSRCFGLRLDD
jgi:hypothetical protein